MFTSFDPDRFWNSAYDLLRSFSQLDETTRVSIAAGAGLFVIIWLFLVIWTARDIADRSESFFFRFFACLIVILFPILGFLFYLAIRPSFSTRERRRLSQEETAVAETTASLTCPSCGALAEHEFVYCPECGAALKKSCAKCGKHLKADWKVCPSCGTPTSPRKVKDVTVPAMPAAAAKKPARKKR